MSRMGREPAAPASRLTVVSPIREILDGWRSLLENDQTVRRSREIPCSGGIDDSVDETIT
jgi:hypothetical protein